LEVERAKPFFCDHVAVVSLSYLKFPSLH